MSASRRRQRSQKDAAPKSRTISCRPGWLRPGWDNGRFCRPNGQICRKGDPPRWRRRTYPTRRRRSRASLETRGVCQVWARRACVCGPRGSTTRDPTRRYRPVGCACANAASRRSFGPSTAESTPANSRAVPHNHAPARPLRRFPSDCGNGGPGPHALANARALGARLHPACVDVLSDVMHKVPAPMAVWRSPPRALSPDKQGGAAARTPTGQLKLPTRTDSLPLCLLCGTATSTAMSPRPPRPHPGGSMRSSGARPSTPGSGR